MKLSKKYFNMVEMVLALAVVSIAIVSLMGVLPVALRASKNSVADNSLATVVEIMTTYIDNQYYAKSSLSDLYNGTNRVFPPPPSSDKELFYRSNLLTPQQIVDDLTTPVFQSGGAMQLYYDSGEPGIYKIELYSGDIANVQRRTTDFSAVVHIWKEQYNGTIYFPLNVLHNTIPSGSDADEYSEVKDYVEDVLLGTTSLPASVLTGREGTSLTNNPPETDSIAITLVMRISYPADASFENQEHRYYKFDYFRK